MRRIKADRRAPPGGNEVGRGTRKGVKIFFMKKIAIY